VEKLNKDPKIHGILVQIPLPKHVNETKVLYAIDPKKDVDGFHPVNLGKLMIGEPDFIPCTPHGIQELLIRSGVKTDGAEVVVLGRSNIVGKPIANIMLQSQRRKFYRYHLPHGYQGPGVAYPSRGYYYCGGW
jgi:methylenetetrahydrofolate dehydrogenase (NADP+)/methenyltetrahydrofolate cyclohydrolase